MTSLAPFIARLDDTPGPLSPQDLTPLTVALLLEQWHAPLRLRRRCVQLGDDLVEATLLKRLPSDRLREVMECWGPSAEPTEVFEVFLGEEPLPFGATLWDTAEAAFLEAIRNWLAARLEDYVSPERETPGLLMDAARLACSLPYVVGRRPVSLATVELLANNSWLPESVEFLASTHVGEVGTALANEELLRLWLNLSSEA